ncbi:dynein axonemal heavy chain 7-like [Anabrus simplex]|uniref:dynein axonemal heavy chain 7-like n=1 Tax=Anabrus simplex TaxID=316456 RepID=UPI0035A2DC02
MDRGEEYRFPSKRRSSSQQVESHSTKARKIVQPEETNFAVEEIFSLPKCVLKKPPLRKGKFAFPPVSTAKKKEPNAVLKRYTDLRKEREAFRSKLVKLIMRKTGDKVTPYQMPSAEEKEVLRYYYYIHHGVDTVHVSPLDDRWLMNIYCLVPAKFKEWKELLNTLEDELKEDFMITVKKAIIDFVLQDPSCVSHGIIEPDSKDRREMKEVTKSTKESFISTRKKIEKILQIVNPCLPKLLDLWYTSFSSSLRLVNVKDLAGAGRAMSLTEFATALNKQIDKARNILRKEWVPEIHNLFLQKTGRSYFSNPEILARSQDYLVPL